MLREPPSNAMHCFNLLSTTTALFGFIWTITKYRGEAADDVFNRNMSALQAYAMNELGDPEIVLDELEAYFDSLHLREEQGLLKGYFGSLASKKAMHRRQAEKLKDLAEKTEAADAAEASVALEAWEADVRVCRPPGEESNTESPERRQCETSFAEETGESVRVKELVESVDGIGSPETREKLAQNTAFLQETLERRSETQNVTKNALLDIWWEGNTAGDPDARQANYNRKKLKRLFEMAWMTQQQSPAPKHSKILKNYLNDNWSATDVQRFLEQVLPMDKAQYRADKFKGEDWKERRPQIYNFIADVFEVRESEKTEMDLLAARINVERRRSRRIWSQVESNSHESEGGNVSVGNGNGSVGRAGAVSGSGTGSQSHAGGGDTCIVVGAMPSDAAL